MNQKLTFFARIFLLLALLLAGLPVNSASAQAPVRLGAGDGSVIQQNVADVSVSQHIKIMATAPVSNAHFGANASLAVQGDVVLVGAPDEEGGDGAAQGAAYIFYRNFTNGVPDAWQQVKRLSASDGVAGDRFGASVAISGDRIFVGAPGGNAVYLFERNNGGSNNWGQSKIVTQAGAQGFGVSVAADGDTLAVGADLTDGIYTDVGAVYLYYRNQGNTAESWGHVKTLQSVYPSVGGRFGYSLSLFNDTLVVGCPYEDFVVSEFESYVDGGGAYVYERNNGGADVWNVVKWVYPTDVAAGDQFGYSVSLGSDLLAVGMPRDDSNKGSAYLFARNQGSGNGWGQIKKVTANDGVASDLFGSSVALNDDRLIVGVPSAQVGGQAKGAVYVFTRNNGGEDLWNQTSKLTGSDSAVNDAFGSVASDGNLIVVGAPNALVGGKTGAGAGYIFTMAGTGWVNVFEKSGAAEADNFGAAVALDGEFMAVGAPGADASSLTDSGAVALYRRNFGGADTWAWKKDLAASSPAVGGRYGQSVSLYGDTLVVGASGQGTVSIYERNQGGADLWGQVAVLNGTAGDKFGYTVSLWGDLLAVGAPATASNNGAVYLYERNKNGVNAWGQVKVLASPVTGAQFGFSVDLDVAMLLVGAPYASSTGLAYLHLRNEGGADNWGQYKQLAATDGAADDHFGWSVSLSDDTALVGAPDDDNTVGVDAGAAYLFYRNQGTTNGWGQKAALTDAQGAASDRFGFSLDLKYDMAVVGNPRAAVNGSLIQGTATVFERNKSGFDAWGVFQRIVAGDGQADDRFGYAVSLDDRFLALGAYSADGQGPNMGAAYLYRLDQVFALTLTVAGSGAGHVTDDLGALNCLVTCSASYSAGTLVTLTAAASEGSVFAGWSGACAGTGVCQVTMSQARSVTATFNKQYQLRVAKQGMGAGLITSSPSGISCSIPDMEAETDCSEYYDPETLVQLTATAGQDAAFAGWGGACSGMGACSVTMNQAQTVTAYFVPTNVNYSLTVSKIGAGSGTVTSVPTGINCGADCTESYAGGTIVTLKAVPAPGSAFVGFYDYYNSDDEYRADSAEDSGLNCASGTPIMDANKTCQAMFVLATTKNIPSTGAQDGWVLESTETSNKGGTMNTALAHLYLGDDAQDRQYRSIVSFNTSSLPDNAVILSAQLKLKYAAVVGTNPFNTHTALKVDLRKGFFGTKAALELADFAAAANLNNVASVGKTATGGWHIANLPKAAFQYINLLTTAGGLTQLRLRFAKDDNDDRGADYLKFFSGNATAKPVLVIQYYVPEK